MTSRQQSGFSTPAEKAWLARHHLRSGHRFHHNFQRLLPEELMARRPDLLPE